MGTEREGIQVHNDEGESVPTDPQHLWSDFIDFFPPTCSNGFIKHFFCLREGRTKQ